MKVLHLVIYEKLYPPKNGGMLRCWNLIQQLGKYAETDVITLQTDLGQKAGKDGYPLANIRFLVPVTKETGGSLVRKALNAIRFRLFYKTLSPADVNFLKIIPVLRSVKDNHYDVVIFEHLESLIAWKKLKYYFPCARFVFDAHNVDHLLLAKKETAERLDKIKNLERSLFIMFDQVLACSTADAAIFRTLNENKIQVTVVPNGIDICRNPYQLPDLSKPGLLIFCGSLDYGPNIEGLSWFLKSVWPLVLSDHAGLKVILVGRGHPAAELLKLLKDDPSIDLVGEVEDVIPYYRKASVAIVPLLHGSGTRLKILEAMSLGVPVVSTIIGAEGIDYANGKNILIADREKEFCEAFNELLNRPVLFGNISCEGRKLVEEKYSWEEIGKILNENLRN
ncbi:MAG: glycosyltransferase family 4 protein [Ginsengibacter sp.]